MSAIHVYSCRVRGEEIDQLGHANNAEYLRWAQAAAVSHSAANGWDWTRYRELGAGWIAAAHRIEYALPALLDDDLRVVTWVSRVRKVVSWRKYRFLRLRDQAVLATAETKWAFVDLHKLRPTRVPSVFWDDFVIIEDDAEVDRWLATAELSEL